MDSYSVRCLFRWQTRPQQRARYLYEERITLWQAESLDHAIELAEQEAEAYADDGDEFLDFVQAYALAAPVAGHGVEVFSLLRESDLEPKEYIDTFFATGTEHEQKWAAPD
jgi:hypothetical protein